MTRTTPILLVNNLIYNKKLQSGVIISLVINQFAAKQAQTPGSYPKKTPDF
jgi:hypothetical protein